MRQVILTSLVSAFTKEELEADESVTATPAVTPATTAYTPATTNYVPRPWANSPPIAVPHFNCLKKHYQNAGTKTDHLPLQSPRPKLVLPIFH